MQLAIKVTLAENLPSAGAIPPQGRSPQNNPLTGGPAAPAQARPLSLRPPPPRPPGAHVLEANTAWRMRGSAAPPLLPLGSDLAGPGEEPESPGA